MKNSTEMKTTTPPTPQALSSSDAAALNVGFNDDDSPTSQVARYNVSDSLFFFLRCTALY